MALGNSVENSINSPWMMQCLIRSGTGGSDVCAVVCCTSVGSNNDWTVVVGCTCTGAMLLVVLVIAGRLGVDICSEAAESISSALDGLFVGISVMVVEGVLPLC